MKKAALVISLLFTLFIAPSPSHADIRTVQTLLGNCENNGGEEGVLCAAMIKGAVGVLSANCYFSAQGYSLPDLMKADAGEVTVAALIQAFKNWARDNPQSWSGEEVTGIIAAISSTFPCKD